MVFIGELRQGRRVTLDSFVEFLERHRPALAVTKKTINRDVIDLRERMRAPIIYVAKGRSYRLADLAWRFPMEFQGEGLLGTLICMRIASPLPPLPALGTLHEVVQAQLTASDPDGFDHGMLENR